jgi:hypothetical protein
VVKVDVNIVEYIDIVVREVDMLIDVLIDVVKDVV